MFNQRKTEILTWSLNTGKIDYICNSYIIYVYVMTSYLVKK